MQKWSLAEIDERLSPRQIEVLELVAQRFSSKEIGLKLSLSPKTIDGHVEMILTKLGASSRSDAGRMFQAALERGEKLPRVSRGLAETMQSSRGSNPLAHDDVDGHSVPDIRSKGVSLARMLFELPPVGGRQHDLSLAQRLVIVGRIAFVSLLFVATIVTIFAGLFRMFSAS